MGRIAIVLTIVAIYLGLRLSNVGAPLAAAHVDTNSRICKQCQRRSTYCSKGI